MTPEQLAYFDSGDAGIGLFHACLKAGAPMTFTPGMRILEVGCCEADWLHNAHDAFPEIDFAGIDWRAPDVVDGDGKVTRMKANGLDPDIFPPHSFDAVVSLSAIEHFGLGHYEHDPLDPEGDSTIVANIWRWLKPGGWFYFDVPYDPTGYRVINTECRVYDDAELFWRLQALPSEPRRTTGGVQVNWRALWIGYCDSKAVRELVPKPTVAAPRYWYCASVFRKA